jgi:hypothetical protein
MVLALWGAVGNSLSGKAAPSPEIKIPEDILHDFLIEGGWSPTGDDNQNGESLSIGLLRRMVEGQSIETPEGRGSLGLFALALGVAEWGVKEPQDLPNDPQGNNWKSDAHGDSGKHLMSYGSGGIGISHADLGELENFSRRIISLGLVPQQYQAAFLQTVSKSRFASGRVTYDQIRVAGTCSSTKFQNDLLGERFRHRESPSDCARHANSHLSAQDWLSFRTWSRAGLRNEEVQRWLLSTWLNNYWAGTLSQLPPGPGRIEEALVNVRVRNSHQVAATEAFKQHASTLEAKLDRQMDAYRKYRASAFKRRCRIMLRPVVMYRHLTEQPQIASMPVCPS